MGFLVVVVALVEHDFLSIDFEIEPAGSFVLQLTVALSQRQDMIQGKSRPVAKYVLNNTVRHGN
ncbi:MAG: hypothetical protein RQ741_02790 [Wenzhouxiangellaceae bacterium]|nr:hypothetical protein [Wenzhouxiangellaceae bacterium]